MFPGKNLIIWLRVVHRQASAIITISVILQIRFCEFYNCADFQNFKAPFEYGRIELKKGNGLFEFIEMPDLFPVIFIVRR